jgi:hypothetical protein
MADLGAWILIGAGMLIVAFRLSRLAKNWDQPEMTAPGARNGAWADVCFAILPIAAGGSILGGQAKSHAIVWAADCTIFASGAAGLFLFTRFRQQDKRSGDGTG